MIALAKFLAVAFVALSVVYASVWFYLRAAHRERLEEEWHLVGAEGDREGHVRAGLEAVAPTLRRRLILWVYVVPLSLMAVVVYITNN